MLYRIIEKEKTERVQKPVVTRKRGESPMKYKVLIASVLLGMAGFGCNDDAGGSSTGTVEKPECTKDSDCASGKCLYTGVCAATAQLKDVCDEEHICAEGLKCSRGICIDPNATSDEDPAEDDTKCSQDSECGEGSVCNKGACTEQNILKENSTCDATDKVNVCDKDLSCHNGKCMTNEAIADEDKCKSDEDCAGEEFYTTCLSNGKCGMMHDVGDICGGDQDFCNEGFECNIGVCVLLRQEGESCSREDSYECVSGLNCVDSVCRVKVTDLDKGEACNDSYHLCKEGLVCRNEVCINERVEDESCNDETYDKCMNGLICRNSICTPFGDACKATSDCQEKDSFCCLDDSCGLNGYCIPYDEHVTHDDSCRFKTKAGIFESQIQCRWQPPSDQMPGSKNVEIPPIVGHFGNKAGLDTVVSFYSYSGTAIRFIHPETCETLETINVSLQGRWNNYPTAADLDGDGLMEIVYVNGSEQPVAYKWDAAQQKHVLWWTAKMKGGYYLMTYDVNGDKIPEVIAGDGVANGQTGAIIAAPTGNFGYSQEPAIGNFDSNPAGLATMVIGKRILKWNPSTNKWNNAGTLPVQRNFLAYADFGTAGATAADFDFKKLDGIPEIVSGGSGAINIIAIKPKGDGTYESQNLLQVNLLRPVLGSASALGGPLTVGDFDNDGLPEIGVASSGYFGVYDPLCTGYEAGKCADKYVLWERWSQDASSGVTGSTLFDFDGDGQAEAVYGDECFTRVYDGKTGQVLFSTKRSSGTASEAPVVADIDGDGSAEMLMGSAGSMSCYDDSRSQVGGGVDPIHEGIRCQDDEDCPMSRDCNKTLGLCTCTTDADCNTQFVNGKVVTQYVCAAPIHSRVGMMTNIDGKGRKIEKNIGTRPDGYDNSYKVCRASRKTTDIGTSDLIIYKDRLDRWVSSRNIWNQHQYNIINIEDNYKFPTPAQWLANWMLKNLNIKIDGTEDPRPVYNNYRLNRQGLYGAGTVPDITGRFIAGSICGMTADGRHVISGKLCNRGTKPVSTKLPASFFYYDAANPDDRSKRICTSYTNAILGVGECDQVGCEVSAEELEALEGHDVIMVTNLDENGFASTVECNSENNTDITHIESCKSEDPIVIVN